MAYDRPTVTNTCTGTRTGHVDGGHVDVIQIQKVSVGVDARGRQVDVRRFVRGGGDESKPAAGAFPKRHPTEDQPERQGTVPRVGRGCAGIEERTRGIARFHRQGRPGAAGCGGCAAQRPARGYQTARGNAGQAARSRFGARSRRSRGVSEWSRAALTCASRRR